MLVLRRRYVEWIERTCIVSGPLIETREKRRGVKGSSYAILILKRSERSCITHTHTYNITLLIRVGIVMFCMSLAKAA